MNTNSQQVMQSTQEALQAAQTAFQTLATALTQALAQVKDMSEELLQVYAVNQRLEAENKAQVERIGTLENDLWNARSERRNAVYERDMANAKLQALETALAESKAEAVKLREVILNVATVTDPIINPRPADPKPIEYHPTATIGSFYGSGGGDSQHAPVCDPETPVAI